MPETVIDPEDGDPVWQLAIGETLLAGLLAFERLGVGLRCETWLAWSVPLWCPAVVKLARPHQVEHPRARASLGREVGALAEVRHPGLPGLLADGRADDIPHLVLEYVDGPTLDEQLDDGPLDSTEAALLGTHLLSALAVVHDRGMAHVDVKPDNVLIRDGRPVLVDFGSARVIGAEQPAGRPIGTAGYAAPELEEAGRITAATDLYGLGVTLFEALVGRPAFDVDLPAARRPRPGALPDAVDARLAQTVRGLLEPEPANRPAAEEVMRELTAGITDPRRRPWPDWANAHLLDRFTPRPDGAAVAAPARTPG